jgi:hypothetical protein
LSSQPRSRTEERYGVEVVGLGSDKEHHVCGHRRHGPSTGTGFEEEEAETRWCAADVELAVRADVHRA